MPSKKPTISAVKLPADSPIIIHGDNNHITVHHGPQPKPGWADLIVGLLKKVFPKWFSE